MLIQNPKRVLHVIHRMRPGGIQTAIMNLYRHIDRTKVQFDFAVRSQQQEYYDKEIKDLGGRLLHLPWKEGDPLSIVAYIQALKTILKESGPFLAVHSHVGLFSGHILPLAKHANIPLRLAHSHSAPSNTPPLIRNIWTVLMRQSIQANATHMLACSSQAANWLYGQHWEKDKRVIKFPNAIDLQPYATLGNDRFKWREVTGLPREDLLIGHIGRFDPVKNHSYLLQVFSAFHKKNSNARLVLVGEGELKQQTIQLIQEKGISDAVIFLGVRADIPQILGALDLFVLPSHHEGFGIVLIEAQAAGIPCLASEGVSPEIDLGLGLVKFESLSTGIETWVQKLTTHINVPTVGWEERKKALQNAGYDIQNSIKTIQSIYLESKQV